VSPTAFVAGATGYVGREVVRVLAARGARVIAHVRPDSPRLEEWRSRWARLGAETSAAPWNEEAMAGELARLRPTHLFALLGTTRARMRAEGADAAAGYEAVDYGLTALLLRVARRVVPDARFVYLSALGVGPGRRNAYLAVRWRLEEELRASGVAYTIARPGFITGADREERRPAERTAARVLDALLGVAALAGGGRLRDRYASTTGAALAEALVRLALDPRAADRLVEAEGLRAE
jgi:uncharacterized protein YbjT (DUF2867 family)